MKFEIHFVANMRPIGPHGNECPMMMLASKARARHIVITLIHSDHSSDRHSYTILYVRTVYYGAQKAHVLYCTVQYCVQYCRQQILHCSDLKRFTDVKIYLYSKCN